RTISGPTSSPRRPSSRSSTRPRGEEPPRRRRGSAAPRRGAASTSSRSARSRGSEMDYLNRSQAPFPSELWETIDEAARSAAADRLTGRRFLDVEGPFGVGLTVIEVGNDEYCRQPAPNEAGAILGRTLPVPMLRRSFRLSIRRVAAYLENKQPLDL